MVVVTVESMVVVITLVTVVAVTVVESVIKPRPIYMRKSTFSGTGNHFSCMGSIIRSTSDSLCPRKL